MKKYTTLLFIAFAFISCNKEVERDKILFVTTNVNQMDGQINGTYLIELAIPFDIFAQNNYEIDIVSPNGGNIPIYHSGDTTDMVKTIIETVLYKNKTSQTLTPQSVNADEYLAVIIPGGYGQFWDTHKNEGIQQIIADIYEANGVIGSVGHGTATLINVKLTNGEDLVKGKTMTSFPSWNEKNVMEQSNFGALLPYDMEVELQKRGAELKIYNHEAKTNYEVIDAENRLVTASFANSGQFVANEVIKLIEQAK